MPKRKKRTPAPEIPQHYLVAITGWDWEYSFGLERSKHFEGPYADYRHLQIDGKLIRPEIAAAETVELTVLPTTDISEARKRELKPQAVASLHLHQGRLTGLVSMPSDALAPVLYMLIADRFRYVSLHGPRLRYRQTLIHSYRLHATLDEEDELSEAGL